MKIECTNEATTAWFRAISPQQRRRSDSGRSGRARQERGLEVGLRRHLARGDLRCLALVARGLALEGK